MLVCPVRGCGLRLVREDRRVVCPRGHSFDVARSGYINLLQPQDRRSRHPGDTPVAVTGRRRLHDRGVNEPLIAAIAQMVDASAADTVLDAGCGNGDLLGTLAARTGFAGHGIDISVGAVDAAARRYPQCQWIVANADRFIPFDTGSVSIVLSITARQNPGEFHRVLRPGGRLLLAIPAPDDLVELRGPGRDRVDRTIALFTPGFRLAAQHRVTTTACLDQAAIDDVLHSIYRPLRRQIPGPRQVTFSLDLLLFVPLFEQSPLT